MVNKYILIALSITLGTLCCVSLGQEAEIAKEIKKEITRELSKEPTKEIVIEERKENEYVVLVINFETPNQILVVGESGKVIQNAKEIKLHTLIGHGTITVQCTMYEGVFKPSTPEVKTWTVKKVIGSTNKEFQEIVDGLYQGNFNLP